MRAHHIKLGVQYGGVCPICCHPAGSNAWELPLLSLYRTQAGQFLVVHPGCAGGYAISTTHGPDYKRWPKRTIDIDEITEVKLNPCGGWGDNRT